MILWISNDFSGSSTSISIWSTDWTRAWRRKELLPFADSWYFQNETHNGGYLGPWDNQSLSSPCLGSIWISGGQTPTFLSPNCFSTKAEISPTTSPVVEVATGDLENPKQSSLSPTLYVIMLHVMRNNTNSRTVIQITKKRTVLALQCVYSHTHVALTRS
jgi:hypothetical protein